MSIIAAVTAGMPILKDMVESFLGTIPDPQERLEKEKLLAQIISEATKGNHETNKIEAQNPSLFVSGWRPFVGWVCGISFAYHFVMQPIIIFALIQADMPPEVPELDIGALTTVLMGMLGLGGLRTYEKLKGVNRVR